MTLELVRRSVAACLMAGLLTELPSLLLCRSVV
jgi:hypothetical protein